MAREEADRSLQVKDVFSDVFIDKIKCKKVGPFPILHLLRRFCHCCVLLCVSNVSKEAE